MHGGTDDFAWHVTCDFESTHDFHATILDHHFQGLDFRLTGVNPAMVVKGLLA